MPVDSGIDKQVDAAGVPADEDVHISCNEKSKWKLRPFIGGGWNVGKSTVIMNVGTRTLLL